MRGVGRALCQEVSNPAHHQVDGDSILSALGDDDVCESLRGLHEGQGVCYGEQRPHQLKKFPLRYDTLDVDLKGVAELQVIVGVGRGVEIQDFAEPPEEVDFIFVFSSQLSL